MITIGEAKRLIKRALLANLATEKPDLTITPLVSGKHGIGKSQMIKSIAQEMGGVCITIEGGTLKEGEITGLPYQYRDESGKVKFRFLPYYAVERIQEEEKRLFERFGCDASLSDALSGDENRYALNDLSSAQKIEALRSGKVRPVILFIDEINRTENSVYEEIFADDEKLMGTGETIRQLSAAKKVQTCNLMLDYLKENMEFIMLDKARFSIVKKQLSCLVKLLDASTRLLFAQNLTSAVTNDGNSLIDLLFDVFEQDLLDMLDLSEQTRKLIEESK